MNVLYSVHEMVDLEHTNVFAKQYIVSAREYLTNLYIWI
jgi:hypothetical protein